ncbi:MAG TPA: ribonuclease D [Gemmatimonadaceae bacterium]|nr:ribonuclease D [Gemmatimonadaceae bacterium]
MRRWRVRDGGPSDRAMLAVRNSRFGCKTVRRGMWDPFNPTGPSESFEHANASTTSRRVTVTSGPHAPLYIDSPRAAERLLESLGGARALAVDTEGASFHRFVDRIYLLQLSTEQISAVFDPLAVGRLERLGALLEDPDVEVVFHDADYDLRLLHQDYGWRTTHIFDTRIAAQILGIRAFGLAALLERYFGIKLDKKFQRADWSMRPLTPAMLEYAAQDTMYLLELRDRMREDLERAGRWEWAEEEFARLEGTHWAPEGEEGSADAYLRIKGVRDLTRRQLAIFRELVLWRDEVARALDRATFRVVGNTVLLEVAQGAPRTIDALRIIKGMPRGIVERRGDELLSAVERGLGVPDAQLPRFPKARRWERDPNFDVRVSRLRTVRDEAAQRLDLDPGFLCSRDRLEAIARKNPTTLDELSEVEELRRWEVVELGEAVLKALKEVGQ